MTLGVDLTDESYYISFLDGWLKTGFRNSDNLVLHQTAELLIFPFVRMFASINAGEQGLALFNRFMYLSISCFAGLCFYKYARTRHSFDVAVLAGLLVISFIPFSLPSLSYNTLGMLSMICALSAFATYASNKSGCWLITSATSWMICVIAYPPLLAVLACLLVATLVRPVQRGEFHRYFLWCIVFQLFGATLLLSAYGLARLEEILAFTNASLQVSSGVSGKLTRAASLLSASRTFLCLCVASAVVGLYAHKGLRQHIGRWVSVVGMVAILIAAQSIGPVLYATAHDYVFLLAVAGLAFFTARTVSKVALDCIPSILFYVGLFAGLVTSITATNSVVNFAVGGFFCVCVFLLTTFERSQDGARPQLVLLGVVIVLFLSSAFRFIYGEDPTLLNSSEARRVQHGVYAGLLTTSAKDQSIRQTTALLAHMKGDSVAVLGRFPSIYLLTSMKPKALSTWDFSQQNGAMPKVENTISAFYSTDTNRPSIVLRTTDPWTAPPSFSGQQLLSHYEHASHFETAQWTIDAFVPTTLP
jgi:hypothetical protein